MGEASPPPPKEGATAEASAPEPARPRLRVTGLAGALAALCVGVSFFLPWVLIEPERAQQFLEAVNRDLDARETPPAGGEAFREIAQSMVDEGTLRGADLIRWVRTAQTFSAELDATMNPGVEAGAHQRRLELLRILLYGIPIGAFLLAAYFLFHRFRRARAPVLILCILVGVAAVVLAATCRFTHTFIGQALREGTSSSGLGHGWMALLAGGAVLGVAGFFGVSTRNWFRVYVASAATMAALAFLALRYLETGRLP